MGLCGSSRCGCGVSAVGGLGLTGSGESGDPLTLSILASAVEYDPVPSFDGSQLNLIDIVGEFSVDNDGFADFRVSFGASGTPSTGPLTFWLPFPPATQPLGHPVGYGALINPGVARYTYPCTAQTSDGAARLDRNPGGVGVLVTSFTPFAWGANAACNVVGRYRVA